MGEGANLTIMLIFWRRLIVMPLAKELFGISKCLRHWCRAATDSRQLLDSRVPSSLVVAYSRVRHTRVGRTLEYATPGL